MRTESGYWTSTLWRNPEQLPHVVDDGPHLGHGRHVPVNGRVTHSQRPGNVHHSVALGGLNPVGSRPQQWLRSDHGAVGNYQTRTTPGAVSRSGCYRKAFSMRSATFLQRQQGFAASPGRGIIAPGRWPDLTRSGRQVEARKPLKPWRQPRPRTALAGPHFERSPERPRNLRYFRALVVPEDPDHSVRQV
jgi:hypothetical protein